jgi:hypothetical protein
VSTAAIEPLRTSRGTTGYGIVPIVDKHAAAPTLVYAAYVVGADATVKLLAFYVDPPAHASGTWTHLARTIASTATVVAREPSRTLRIGPMDSDLALELPTTWTSALAVGQEIRYRLFKTTQLGTLPSSCDLVIGASAPTIIPDDAATSQGHLLDRSVVWRPRSPRHARWSNRFTGELLAAAHRTRDTFRSYVRPGW